MTWHDLAVLIRELYAFITMYGQFEFRVEMANSRSELLGSGDLNYIQGPSLNSEAANTTKSLAANLTTLPPDTMTFHVPDSGISIEFSNIGQAISADDVGSCLFQALFSIIEVLVDEGGDTDIEKSHAWRFQHAFLQILPAPYMKYGDLSKVIQGILITLNTYGYWVYNFMRFFDEDRGRIGAGILNYV
ncbi:MAG: hypothetical protein HETSPECPRED_008777 [Heterodermia speciosa]|uniref:Uncharacterized protein n=1 Tax=Heterodermia speciosa TaxID=116794 RepID=A0A8H3ENS5_9LECA|nr:MAG: hypothetical protein HETSPECPRED_008777 [Heterodermia speciosa]